jgi:holliday junction DNA helicase RuvB
VREGLLGRTPRGRIAMAPAWTHLGYAIPSGVFAQEQLDLFEPAGDGEPAGDWAPESQ